MRDPSNPFFRTLAGSRPSENYLSRTFQACFSDSPAFAQSMLTLLWERCGLSGKPPDAGQWVCDYQSATPANKSIRPDLCLRPFLSQNEVTRYKPIYLESKVNARLEEKQLANYVESGTEILVAITKNWPEVSRKRIAMLGANHLRWQEVARQLALVKSRNARDKFLCEQFIGYLEYSGMTYREDITAKQLEQVRTLFANIGTPYYVNFVPGPAFEIADSCMAVLRDVRRIAHEILPKLTKCSNWGPGYYHEQNEDDYSIIDSHVIGMEMYVKGKYRKSRLLCGLCFSAHTENEIRWLVAHRGSQSSKGQERRTLISKVLAKKKLDAAVLAQTIVDKVKQWKMF